MQDVQRLGPLQRQADAALPAVGVLHQGREGAAPDRHAHHRAEAALGVTPLCVLDFDHVGAPIRQDRAGRGHERELGDLEDTHARHGSDHQLLAGRTWITSVINSRGWPTTW